MSDKTEKIFPSREANAEIEIQVLRRRIADLTIELIVHRDFIRQKLPEWRFDAREGGWYKKDDKSVEGQNLY